MPVLNARTAHLRDYDPVLREKLSHGSYRIDRVARLCAHFLALFEQPLLTLLRLLECAAEHLVLEVKLLECAVRR